MILPNRYHISLRPVDHEDGVTPAGLLLMPDEFTDMVQKKFPAGRFKKDFPDYVTRVTAGHVGAVEDLLRGVLAHQASLRVETTVFTHIFPVIQPTQIWQRGVLVGNILDPVSYLGILEGSQLARCIQTWAPRGD